ncbi:unnamed protein product, partial [Mesorhabditis belari]|uniref:Uncharacterized protein n=1 Tax=Mesorhabditis belari TaxID=2138241 RepID=A0AAF3EBB6_9BILA
MNLQIGHMLMMTTTRIQNCEVGEHVTACMFHRLQIFKQMEEHRAREPSLDQEVLQGLELNILKNKLTLYPVFVAARITTKY